MTKPLPMLALLLACALATAEDSKGDPSESDVLQKEIASLFDRHRGRVAAAVKNLQTGESYEWNADRVMPTASLIKLPVMIEAYRRVDAGELSLDKQLTLAEEDKVPGSGVLTEHFSAGVKLPLRDAIHLMIVYSDNTATNLVIDQIGIGSTTELMDELGYPETRLNAKVWRRDLSIAPERSKEYGLGSTTAAEVVGLLTELYGKEVASDESCDAMLGHLRACQDDKKVRRFLPDGVKVANKTGAVSESRTDAGVIESKAGPIAYCLLTTDNDDTGWSDENEAELLAAEFGRRVYAHFVGDTDEDAVPAARVLAVGDDGDLVADLQRTVNAKLDEKDRIGVDGDFGPATEGAVKKFQEQAGLEPSGRVDMATWRALGPLVEEDDPPPSSAEPAPLAELEPADPLDGPPVVTCKAYAIADGDTGEVLWGYNDAEPRDPASTTKIMTAYTVLKLAEKDPSVLDEEIVFTKAADDTSGSTSDVRAGEKLTVRQCLYGLMLPSGNDASVALAEHFGERAEPDDDDDDDDDDKDEEEEGDEEDEEDEDDDDDDDEDDDSPLAEFIEAMNDHAELLGMDESHFENTHGLTADGHQLSARDLVKLVHAARQLPLFREITGTRRESATLDSVTGYQRNVVWNNTNRLLGIEGFDGVKTGTTGRAGACLASTGVRDGKRLIVVVLGSSCSDARYADSRNLYRWAWQELLSGDGDPNDQQ
ncbi:serine hydrolase [Botrimarina sp.]|uniref:serine hydrolase n=1 Tax=Botrimarina sp. TaxID=2795802 RepID=UPI0032EB5E88